MVNGEVMEIEVRIAKNEGRGVKVREFGGQIIYSVNEIGQLFIGGCIVQGGGRSIYIGKDVLFAMKSDFNSEGFETFFNEGRKIG
jgi:hypothetical protein